MVSRMESRIEDLEEKMNNVELKQLERRAKIDSQFAEAGERQALIIEKLDAQLIAYITYYL